MGAGKEGKEVVLNWARWEVEREAARGRDVGVGAEGEGRSTDQGIVLVGTEASLSGGRWDKKVRRALLNSGKETDGDTGRLV